MSIQKESYYKLLAHAIKEAEKPMLFCVSWRPRKASGVVPRPERQWDRFQSKPSDLGTRNTEGRKRVPPYSPPTHPFASVF